MRRATSEASEKLAAVPLSGCMRPSRSTRTLNRSRSSAWSMASGLVPIIRTPARSRGIASLRGVWPPNWTMTPSGCSVSMMLRTSSNVKGSK